MIVLIPAHNEQDCIAGTITSIKNQTVRGHRIIVVSDNSTDDTVKIAKDMGIEVIETVDNTHKKAGALNQALQSIEIDDFVLIMDADTQLSGDFIKSAMKELENPIVGAVGAVFTADRRDSYVRYCQYLEWMRYANQLDRTGKVFVLSGTAAVFRPEALKSVKEKFGYYYNTDSMTEDSAMTIQLKSCGWELKSPQGCKTQTETMDNFRSLIVQRTRWTMGAMQNIKLFGVNRVTLEYLGQQIMLGISVLMMTLLIASSIFGFAVSGIHFSLFWLCIGAIFLIERVISVDGWKERFFAALLVPELVYAIILQWSYVKALWSFVTNKQIVWHRGD